MFFEHWSEDLCNGSSSTKRAANGKFKVIQMKPAYVHFNASAFFPQDSQRSCENLDSALFTRKAISSPKTNHSLGTTANDSEILNSILQKWLIKTSFTQKGSYRKTLFHHTPSCRQATNPSASRFHKNSQKFTKILSSRQHCFAKLHCSEILNSILQKWLIKTSFTQKGSYRKTLFHRTPSCRQATNPSASRFYINSQKFFHRDSIA